MKYFLSLLFVLLCSFHTNAQIFHENFENPDSVTSSGAGIWAQNNRIATSGIFSDSASILNPSDVTKMTTISFSTLFTNSVFLYFNHICKIDFFDNANIQFSLDGGINWVNLVDEPANPANNCYYLTNSTFRLTSRFNEASYAIWYPGLNILPDSTWWQREIFDVSSVLANQPDVQIRFTLSDGNNNGGGGKSGWYIDDILISDTLDFTYLPLSNQITGKVFLDINSNAIMDGTDVPIENLPVYSMYWQLGNSATNSVGNYSLFVQQTDSVFFLPFHYGQQINYFNLIPSIDTSIFTGYQQTDSLNDFAFQPLGNFDDLSVTIWNPAYTFTPGVTGEICLKYGNNGTTIQNPTLVLKYDSSLTYLNTSGMPPTQITADSIVWNLTGVNPLFSELLRVKFIADTTLTTGMILYNSAYISSAVSDIFLLDNTDSILSFVTTSFDPNFIEVNPEIIFTPQLSNDPVLEYTIHFQNTGNDLAYYIRIEQSIPPEFDLNSYELLASSHDMTMFYNGFMKYTFNNIMLPDSASDPEGSQGFITFRIRPKSGLVAGDSIFTMADIYFDYNLPVTTNTALTKIVDPLSTSDVTIKSKRLSAYPNPATEEILLNFYSEKNKETSIEIFNIHGKKVKEILSEKIIAGTNYKKFNIADLLTGIYFIRMEIDGNMHTTKFAKIKSALIR